MKNKLKAFRNISIIICGLAIFAISCTKEEELEPYTGLIQFNANIVYDSISDIEGNVYKTLVIGKQTWMAENLKTTTLNDGTPIQKTEENTAWEGQSTPSYCWYINDEEKFKNTYGALYNYIAVATEKICPEGWHVPLDEEWTKLEMYLDSSGYNTDNTKELKNIAKSMASPTGWVASTLESAVGNSDYATYMNKSGFSALPAGYRSKQGLFSNIGKHANWWAADTYEDTIVWSENGYSDIPAWARDIYTDKGIVDRYFGNRKIGISVRCVKDL